MNDSAPALFTTPAMAAVFSPRTFVAQMLRVEAALARAGARAGLVPPAAAEAIAAACDVDRFDVAALYTEVATAGTPAIPLVRRLTEIVAAPGRGHVHQGATSQDVVDTAVVLQMRDGLDLLVADLGALCDAAAGLAERHRTTLMAGRTLLQQALPITFGLKAARWLALGARQRQALRLVRRDALAVQLGGAAGTLAAFGDRGLAVAESLADELGLPLPELPWHAERDRVAAVVAALGVVAGSMGKIALDVALLAQTEVGEAAEAAAPGKGGSSALPQKRNPVDAVGALAAARLTIGAVPVVLGAMAQEHERAVGGWQAEWVAVPDAFRHAAGAVARTRQALDGLEIDAARMRENLDRGGGAVMAESLAVALAGPLGRGEATRVAEEVSRAAARARVTLREAALGDARVRGALSEADVARALDPGAYLGSTDALIDRALDAYRAAWGGRAMRADAAGPHVTGTHVTVGDGCRLAYRLDGPAGAPVLLLVNSLGTTLDAWAPQAAAFAGRFRVLRYDARGHGASDVPPGAYSLDRLGRDAVELLDALGIARAHVCGLSLGGMVGQWLGARAPARVGRLVLACTAPYMGPPAGWQERIDAVLREGMGAVVDGVLGRWFTPGFRARSPGAVAPVRAMLLSAAPAGYAGCCAAIRDMDLRPTAPLVTVPVRLVAGVHDPVTPPEQAAAIARALPGGAEVVRLDAAHLANVEQPEAFARAVLDFLT
ncbi:hypothetical protein tb265_32530 [Gemmatimonadetes bacterium T265]|nr:hypothetical protein tb265_32530 [Gemmatimonadetes bacterium T265]